jgi:hypothetical protein
VAVTVNFGKDVTTSINDAGGKSTAGVNYASGQQATEVIDFGGAPLLANISQNF